MKGTSKFKCTHVHAHTHKKPTQWGLCGCRRQLELLQRKIQQSVGIPVQSTSYLTVTVTFSDTHAHATQHSGETG